MCIRDRAHRSPQLAAAVVVLHATSLAGSGRGRCLASSLVPANSREQDAATRLKVYYPSGVAEGNGVGHREAPAQMAASLTWNNVRRRTLTSRVARSEKRKVNGSIPSLPTHLTSGNTVRL